MRSMVRFPSRICCIDILVSAHVGSLEICGISYGNAPSDELQAIWRVRRLLDVLKQIIAELEQYGSGSGILGILVLRRYAVQLEAAGREGRERHLGRVGRYCYRRWMGRALAVEDAMCLLGRRQTIGQLQ